MTQSGQRTVLSVREKLISPSTPPDPPGLSMESALMRLPAQFEDMATYTYTNPANTTQHNPKAFLNKSSKAWG